MKPCLVATLHIFPEEIEGNSIKFPGLIEFTKDSKINKSKYS